ncbi:MAG: hypothetical protein HMLKMBBP_00457 [Planctomycetes bacterium]|nr:hypothetical protein [Planctomycetota bacterium]
MTRTESREVRHDRADAPLPEFAAAQAAAARPWVLVAEGGDEEAAAVARDLGRSASLREEVRGWRIFEVAPSRGER